MFPAWQGFRSVPIKSSRFSRQAKRERECGLLRPHAVVTGQPHSIGFLIPLIPAISEPVSFFALLAPNSLRKQKAQGFSLPAHGKGSTGAPSEAGGHLCRVPTGLVTQRQPPFEDPQILTKNGRERDVFPLLGAAFCWLD